MLFQDNALKSMIAALEREISHLRRTGGSKSIELRGGERVGQMQGGWLYKFAVDEELYLRDDTPIKVTYGDYEVDGTVISFHEGVLTVLLSADLGAILQAVRLIADEAFLLERLKERLVKIQQGDLRVNLASARRVLGLMPARIGEVQPDPRVIIPSSSGRLNTAQESAVRKSLASEVTYIWGPPGTGKTMTLARVVEAHVRHGRSVLLVSNTNTAVDTALERITERLKDEPEFERGMVLRYGPIVRDTLEERFGNQVIPTRVVERLSAHLSAERAKLSSHVKSLESRATSLKKALSEVQRLNELQRTITGVMGAKKRLEEEIRAREHLLGQIHLAIQRLKEKLHRAHAVGSIRRLLFGLSPERLQQQMADYQTRLRQTKTEIEVRREEVKRKDAEIVRLSSEIEWMKSKTQSYPDAATLQAMLAETEEQLTGLRQRLAALEAQLVQIEKEVMQRCRVLATTVYRVYLSEEIFREYDVVVIDEASMVILPLVYYAASLARQTVVVAGDFRQLPPIVTSEDDLVKEWLGKDVFRKAGIPEQVARGEPNPHLVVLDTQYRMCPAICDVINEYFYRDHPLKSAESVNRVSSGFPLGAHPLMYIDTANFHPWASLQVGSFSRYNLFHALLIRNIVTYLADTGYISSATGDVGKLGVITPYSAQARIIRATLTDAVGKLAVGMSGTVHRFQGNEKEVVIVDLCDSTGVPLSQYHKATTIEEVGARLLNVAISRARQHLILVGNFDFILSKAPAGAVTRKVIEYFLERGRRLDVEQMLPLGARDWIDGLTRVFPHTFELPDHGTGIFNETTFYPAFRSDLRRAQKSIIILSPFITESGASRWADTLRSAVACGVQVHVFTRPPGDFGAVGSDEVSKVIHHLRSVGVAVHLRRDMHEKIVIIDGRILWVGSLNILSHRDTHESMMRIPSKDICNMFMQLFAAGADVEFSDSGDLRFQLPMCPNCGGPMIWVRKDSREYYRCENPACRGTVRSQQSRPRTLHGGRRGVSTKSRGVGISRESKEEGGFRECPRCGGLLVERTGRYGRFLGCANYPGCTYTQGL